MRSNQKIFIISAYVINKKIGRKKYIEP